MTSSSSRKTRSAAICWIVTVGDELLNGIRVDTNTAWLAERLSRIGIKVVRAVSVGDGEEAIKAAVKDALAAADVVIISGGLGPTQDDRTKEAVAALYGVELKRQAEVEEAVRKFFADRGRETTQINLDQALVPEGFGWSVNRRGTAPGLMKQDSGTVLFALPGVPGELKALYNDWVSPLLAERFGEEWVFLQRWYRTTGIGESDLFDRVGGLEDLAPAISLSYLPSPEGTALYLTGQGEDSVELESLLDEAEDRITENAGTYLYAKGNVDLAVHIASLLAGRELTLATAESCTGGMIAHNLTNVPGASDWFLRGWVTYSNEAKEEDLGVQKEILVEHGAVSEPVAKAMAEGARIGADSDYAIAVTGIAGPAGGTEEKPVGLTYVACAGPDGAIVRRYLFGGGGRWKNKSRSMASALDLLRRVLEGYDPYEGGWERPGPENQI